MEFRYDENDLKDFGDSSNVSCARARAAHCEDRTIEFVFAFKLEDPPTDHIVPAAVRFVPPNRFELVFRRIKPILDLASRADTNDRK